MDVLNLIALAKMSVVVIGVFLVPILTRKFASELGLAVGQMAMNRSALAAGALTLGSGKVVAMAASSALEHLSAPTLGKVGSKLRSLSSMQNQNLINPQNAQVCSLKNSAKQKAVASLEKFGAYLEAAPQRLSARKAGVEVPTIGDRIKKAVSTNPRITGPIHAKEKQFQNFIETNSSCQEIIKTLDSGHAPQNVASHFKIPATSNESLGFSNSFRSSVSKSVNLEPASSHAQSGAQTYSRQLQERDAYSVTPQQSEVLQTNINSRPLGRSDHRWLKGNRTARLFDSPERKS